VLPDNSQRVGAIVRPPISVLGIVVCLLLIVWSGQYGLSRVLGRYALLTHSISAAAEAVRLTPWDPDAHRALSTTFREVHMFREAEREVALAASLRPNDDLLWLDLGTARDQLEDAQGALSAFDQAVTRAPYYAHTRWERANVRLRMGRYDEAFAELREAAKSNRMYLSTLIDLAWGLSRGDAKETEQLAGIESANSRVEFARFLALKGEGTETLEQYKQAESCFTEVQKRQLVQSLMAAHEYEAAFAIWSGADSKSSIYDGGFEGVISFDEVGFGWHVPRAQSNIEVSLDTSEKESGSKSIRVAYKGDSPPESPVLTQTVVVKPNQTYRIYFAVKANNIVSGGLPVFAVNDARSNTVLSITNLPENDGAWEKRTLEFTTAPTCQAIALSLKRKQCQSSPCPIFGTIWLDGFAIEELKH